MAGFFYRGRMTVTRVAVFIDYQNVYRGAQRAFFGSDSSHHIAGQVNPLKLGLVLAGTEEPDRELVEVRTYRGLPSSKHDPIGYAAAYRQITLWENEALVVARHRPINYRDPRNPREKGIDVLLAVDFVMMAIREEFDVGVIFSADTDLLPALEAVAEAKGPQACEVAAWIPSDGTSPIVLRPPGLRVRVHGLNEQRKPQLHDPNDSSRRRRRR
jgi:uncharacterized LabA/DUF88 family protein